MDYGLRQMDYSINLPNPNYVVNLVYSIVIQMPSVHYTENRLNRHNG